MKKSSITISIVLAAILLLASNKSSAGSCLSNNCHQELTTTTPLHGPVAAEMAGSYGCITCHQPAGKACTSSTGGKFIFTKEDKEMCLRCHGGEAATKHTINEKTCLPCHNPHGSEIDHNFLRKNK